MTVTLVRWLPACSLLLGACTASTEGWVVEAYGVVVDEEGDPVDEAEVTLFNADTDAYLGVVSSISDGSWRIPVVFEEEGQVPLLIVAEKSGYATGQSWAELFADFSKDAVGLIVGPTQRLDMGEQRLPAVWLVSEGEGSGTGFLRYADYSDGMQGEVMSIRKGWNAPADAEVISWDEVQDLVDQDCSSQCWWELAGETGVYTVSLEATVDHDFTRFPVWVTPEGRDDQLGLLVHYVEEDELWAALHWDATEDPVHLHLSGPRAGGGDSGGRYQVYYDEPQFPDTEGNPVVVAAMVLEEADLESAAVYDLRSSGEYRVSAHLEGGQVGLDIADMGVQIYLWWQGGMTMSQVSPGVAGTVWNALELDVETLEYRHLQSYADSAAPDDVGAF